MFLWWTLSNLFCHEIKTKCLALLKTVIYKEQINIKICSDIWLSKVPLGRIPRKGCQTVFQCYLQTNKVLF